MDFKERKIGDISQRRYAVAEITTKPTLGALAWLLDWHDFAGPVAYDPKCRELVLEYPTAKKDSVAWMLDRIGGTIPVSAIAFEVLRKAADRDLAAEPRLRDD